MELVALKNVQLKKQNQQTQNYFLWNRILMLDIISE